ncbi:hypothetical protein AgCh_011880 [Apium graveolens]
MLPRVMVLYDLWARVCELLLVELERLLKINDVPDLDEISRLRSEVGELKIVKSHLERSLDELTKKNDSSATQIFTLLTEKSELPSKCNPLEVGLRDAKIEVEGLNAALGAFKDNLAERERETAWTVDKAELITKLDEMGANLARCEDEALKSFEEVYGECLSHLARVNMDAKDHDLDSYLADWENKVQVGKTASSLPF